MNTAASWESSSQMVWMSAEYGQHSLALTPLELGGNVVVATMGRSRVVSMQHGFLRGAFSFVLVLTGTALFLFSALASSGWDRGPVLPLAIFSTIVALLGLSSIFAGYWIVRNSDGAPIPAVALKLILGLGSSFIVIGVIALFLRNPYTPTAYFLMTGCLCIVGFLRFRGYTARR